MSTTLGKTLEYGSPSILQLWLSESDNLSDPAVFLVRAGFGSPAFARVCTEADLHNYPDSDLTAPGWYRASGLELELDSSETMGKWLTSIQSALEALDNASDVSASVSVPDSVSIPLRMYRTGSQIGTLNVDREDQQDSLRLTLTVTLTDPDVQAVVPTDVFRVSSGEFRELLGIRTVAELDDVSTSVQDFETSVTVWLSKESPELESQLLEAISADIENLCSFAVVSE